MTAKRRKSYAGRPAFKPTRDHRLAVQVMAGFGMRQDEIRRAVTHLSGKPITEKTLRAHFREELDNGRAVVQLGVCTNLYQRMRRDVSGAVAMFLGRSIVGLKETSIHELTGKDGGPIETADVRKRNLDLVNGVASRAAGDANAGAEG